MLSTISLASFATATILVGTAEWARSNWLFAPVTMTWSSASFSPGHAMYSGPSLPQ
jgi:hypothetical protein